MAHCGRRGRTSGPSSGRLLVLGALVVLVLGALLLTGGSPSLPAVVPLQSATPAPTGEPTAGPAAEASVGPVAEASVGPSATPPVFPSPPEPAAGTGRPDQGRRPSRGSRDEPLVVALDDGRVLVVGGLSDAPGEIVDLSARQSTVTDPGAVTGDGSGVLLRDGRVLLVLTDSNDHSSRRSSCSTRRPCRGRRWTHRTIKATMHFADRHRRSASIRRSTLLQ